jgi:hypothetical protein
MDTYSAAGSGRHSDIPKEGIQMITTVTPEFFGSRYCKKSESTKASKSRKSNKTLLAKACWPMMEAGSDNRATVLRSGLCSTRWDRLDDETRALIYQLALNEAGECYPFSLDISHSLVAKGLASRKPFSTWINERLSHYLQEITNWKGEELPFWFSIELSPTGVFHLHGAIGANHNQLPEMERLLKKVAGESNTSAHKHFVHVGTFDPERRRDGFYGTFGWVAYSVKELRRTERLCIGSPLVCRRPLKHQARQIWDELRKEHRRRAIEALLGRKLPEPPESSPAAAWAVFVGATMAIGSVPTQRHKCPHQGSRTVSFVSHAEIST